MCPSVSIAAAATVWFGSFPSVLASASAASMTRSSECRGSMAQSWQTGTSTVRKPVHGPVETTNVLRARLCSLYEWVCLGHSCGVIGFEIRAPRPDEAEAIADLHLRTWSEAYEGKFPPSAWGIEARVQRLAMWESICREPGPRFRAAVVESSGELIGFAGVGQSMDEPPPREKQLWFIYLLERAHGSGAAQSLLDDVLGDDPASLWVLADNPRARAFYRRNGFREDGTSHPTGYADAGDEIRMLR